MYIFMRDLSERKHGDAIDHIPLGIQDGAANAYAFFIPSMMIRYALDDMEAVADYWKHKFSVHERMLGIDYRDDNNSRPDLVNVDFKSLVKVLNDADDAIAYITWTFKGFTQMLDSLGTVTDRYQKQATAHDESEDDVFNTTRVLSETHAALRCRNMEIQNDAEYLFKRCQLMSQRVRVLDYDQVNVFANPTQVYTVIAQQNSKLTLRDSKVMKIIAAITMFFLPATFVAVSHHGSLSHPSL